MNIETAIEIATKAHKGQTDKGGFMYIMHPLTVMLNMSKHRFSESYLVVAVLHDVIEDTNFTIDDRIFDTLTDEERSALIAITRQNSDKTYSKYIERLSSNEIARHVKMFDLMHNMDMSRLVTITEKDIRRYDKYLKTFNYLNSIS